VIPISQARYFSSTAQPTQLTSNISSSTTSIPVAAITGFPSNYPYTIAIDYGDSLEELCDVTSAAGLNFNVTRAVDGTSAASHSAGAVIRHVSSARDFNLFYIHMGSTSGVHGVTGNVVGDTDVQTLSNKTFITPTLASGTISGTWNSTSTIFDSTSASLVPFTVQGFPAQSANIFNVSPSSGSPLFSVGSGATSTATAVVDSPSGQTADIIDFQVNGSTVASISALGALTASGITVSSGIGQKFHAVKTGPTSRLSGTATADPDLTFSLPAAGLYEFEASLGVGSTGANGMTGQFICSTTTSGSYAVTIVNSSGQGGTIFPGVLTGLGSQNFTTYAASGTIPNGCMIKGQLTVSGAGTFALYWSGTSGSVTTTLTTGTYMSVTRIA
jgi:hypothetical protein